MVVEQEDCQDGLPRACAGLSQVHVYGNPGDPP